MDVDGGVMARIKFKGIDDVIDQFERLHRGTPGICKEVLNAGCAVIGNAQKAAIEALPVDNRRYGGKKRNGIRPEQKDALVKSYGIAPVREKNFVYNRKTGFDGYNSIVTKRWPKGQPNAMIARSVESGTSFMAPHPFMDKAARGAKAEAEAAMQAVLDEKAAELVGS